MDHAWSEDGGIFDAFDANRSAPAYRHACKRASGLQHHLVNDRGTVYQCVIHVWSFAQPHRQDI